MHRSGLGFIPLSEHCLRVRSPEEIADSTPHEDMVPHSRVSGVLGNSLRSYSSFLHVQSYQWNSETQHHTLQGGFTLQLCGQYFWYKLLGITFAFFWTFFWKFAKFYP